jgi:P27 family predicted phage terminase small subunit
VGRSKSSSAAKKAPKRRRQSVAELAPQILDLLPGRAGSVARELGRKPSDGTVRRALEGLVQSGAAVKNGPVYERCQELPTLATPHGSDDAAKALHASALKALQEQGTWRDHDIQLLNDLVRRDQDARTFREAVEEQGRFQSSEGGRVYAHPGIDKERDARRDVQTLRDALVLTPDARKKHGRDGEDEEGDALDDF